MNLELKQNIECLAERFEKWDLSPLNRYVDIISSSKQGRIFPPYIPLVGSDYEENRLLIYATAQNLSWSAGQIDQYAESDSIAVNRLQRVAGKEYAHPDYQVCWTSVDIAPYDQGVLPALAGIFIEVNLHKRYLDFQEIQKCLAVSNYYKFSLRNKKRDINPNSLSRPDPSEYWNLNDKLVEEELKVLRPRFVISFRGRQIQTLNRLKDQIDFKVFQVNDPAWILHGGSGCFKSGGSWATKAASMDKSSETWALIQEYVRHLQGKYLPKKELVATYLAWYYQEWMPRARADR